MVEVVKNRAVMDSLPFISPVLWIDWLAVSAIVWQFQKRGKARYIPQVIALAVFGMNTWLILGYILISYGTNQYEVRDVPALCQATAASLVMDPRRTQFARLHIVLYIFGLIAFVVLALVAMRSKCGKLETPAWRLATLLTVSVGIVIPTLVGVILAAVLNRADVLLLSSGECYTGVVSGKFGYFTIDSYDWTERLRKWLGLNV